MRFFGSKALIVSIGLATVLLYAGSYLIYSLRGEYAPFDYKPVQARLSGGNIWEPRHGVYAWFPFESRLGHRDSVRPFFYYPLLELDRKYWHTEEKLESFELESFEYPVKNYYDWETETYRDIIPVER
jgi:hypothetical protein